ncbi:hypothetical protein ABS642_14390 [Microbacterium sp. A8/3-1]|uniref:Uncharacterized protein n=1 Tax=Microbacterium sp. A8/3-1 TaxID=3160749 RepID=A0AAU7VUB3_9MICO
MRIVVDPLLPLDEATKRYFELLGVHDQSLQLLRRREKKSLQSAGDYAVIAPAEINTDNGWGGVIEMNENGTRRSGIPYAENNKESAYNWADAYGLDAEEARERSLDAQAAIALNAHVYVTDNAYALHGLTMRIACTPQDALAVIGLHQRLRSHVLVGLDEPRIISTWMAEHTQAITMLPAVSAQFEGRQGIRPHDETLALLRAMLIRLKRALGARDRLLVSSLHPDGLLGFEEPDELVERTVVSLQGIFDAAGRALNNELVEPAAQAAASFARKDFRRVLPDSVRDILDHQDNRALLRVISVLRNTIHNEPFGRAAYEEHGEVESLATLEGEPAVAFRMLAAQLGRTQRWTYFEDQPSRPGRERELVLRPLPLIEDLIVLSAQLANALITAAPWALYPSPAEESSENWSTYPPFSDSVRRGYGLPLR